MKSMTHAEKLSEIDTHLPKSPVFILIEIKEFDSFFLKGYGALI